MRKKLSALCIGIAAAAAVSSASYASSMQPSFLGATGSLTTPTGETLPVGSISLGYWQSDDSDHKMGAVAFGVAPHVEVSAAHLWAEDDKTFISGKFSLLREGAVIPAVAAGVLDIGDERDTTVYLAATKNLPFGFKCTLGYGNGIYDGVFGSVEKTVSLIPGGDDLFPATTLVVEYDAEDWNYGARLAIAGGAKLTVGHFYDRTYIGATFVK